MNKKDYIVNFLLLIFAVISFIFLFNYFGGKNYSNKVVNIVFTTDINYKDYLKTTIRSAIDNKKNDTVYNINILCVDMPKQEIDKFKKFNGKNVNINPIAINLKSIEHVGNYKISYTVTRADLFKFFMPALFPDLDKILYIDVDTVILGDLRNLYNTDIRGKYIGVVNKCLKEHSYRYLYKKYYYTKRTRFYNCGVMLYNLDLWRKHDITAKLVEQKNKALEKKLMTQNVFNTVIPLNKTKRLSPVNNIFTQWNSPRYNNLSFFWAFPQYCFIGCDFNKLVKRGVIMHYLDDNKPWIYRDREESEYWLLYENKEDY